VSWVIGIVLVNLETIAIVTIQPILCADPQVAAAVLKNSQPGVLRESVFDGEMLKTDDTARRKIQVNIKSRTHGKVRLTRLRKAEGWQ
jgi:hypothetical protein